MIINIKAYRMSKYSFSRLHIFIILLATVYILWLGYFFIKEQWYLFASYWPMSLTMVLGGVVAGSSAIGGGGVAYPVFTKVLQISPEDARTFSLMIQTVGMGMASVFIWAKGIRVLWRVILITSIGGLLGLVVGTFWLQIPTPYQKLTLTYVMSLFGCVLIYLTWGKRLAVFSEVRLHTWRRVTLLFVVGILGGVLSANVGSGIDILTFIILTLVFGVNEKLGTPTTVIIMAINAAAGFWLHAGVIKDIQPVYDFWLVCIPIVALGAPLGAFLISIVQRHHLILFLLGLISLEFISTLLLIPQSQVSILFGIGLLCIAGCLFWLMLGYRLRIIHGESD